MSLKSIGEALVKEHNDLFFELIKIPEERNILFQIDGEKGHQIVKPRFDPPLYSWSPELFARFRSHLQRIKNFFDSFSYWFDDTIKPLISFDEGRSDKNSIIFLLEQDVDQTNVIYADYLIEKDQSRYAISYFRNEKKKHTFEPAITSQEHLETWICNNARRQIIDRFTFLWNYIQDEIEVCMKGDYNKLPDRIFTPKFIKEQNNIISTLIEDYPELALLNLGRISELYLLQLLQLNNKPYGLNLAWEARTKELLTNSQVKLFESIRKETNALKHQLYFAVNQEKITQLWKNFSSLMKKG